MELVTQVKADPESAPITPKLRALLAIAAKVQQGGRNVGTDDIERARAEGATDLEIHDTVLIAAAFCMYNRYVDGLGTWAPTDDETYEMIQLTEQQLGEAKDYLLDGMKLEILYYKDEPLSLELPITVDLTVTYTEPGFKGDTATGGTKPATLETGLVVQVPLFVTTGEKIRVKTDTGTYVERVG